MNAGYTTPGSQHISFSSPRYSRTPRHHINRTPQRTPHGQHQGFNSPQHKRTPGHHANRTPHRTPRHFINRTPHRTPQGQHQGFNSPQHKRTPRHHANRTPHRTPRHYSNRTPHRTPHGQHQGFNSPQHNRTPRHHTNRTPHRTPRHFINRTPHRTPQGQQGFNSPQCNRTPRHNTNRTPHRTPRHHINRTPLRTPHGQQGFNSPQHNRTPRHHTNRTPHKTPQGNHRFSTPRHHSTSQQRQQRFRSSTRNINQPTSKAKRGLYNTFDAPGSKSSTNKQSIPSQTKPRETVKDMTRNIEKEPDNMNILLICGNPVPYGYIENQLYLSCKECFSFLGIAKHISRKGYKSIYKVKGLQKMQSIFAIHKKTNRWITGKALSVILLDPLFFPTAKSKKSLMLEEVKKLMKRGSVRADKNVTADAGPNDQSDETNDQLNPNQHSNGQNASPRLGGASSENMAELNPAIMDRQGFLNVFGKQIHFIVTKKQLFLQHSPIFEELKLTSNKINYGYKVVDKHLQEAGLNPKDNFVSYNGHGRERTHISFLAMLHILDSKKLGDATIKRSFKNALCLQVNNLAIDSPCLGQRKEDDATTDKSKISWFISEKYHGNKSEFLHDLLKLIGSPTVGSLTIDANDLIDTFTKGISHHSKRQVLTETVHTMYKELHPVCPEDTIHLSENEKGTRLLDGLRKLLPGILPSQMAERVAKGRSKKAFNAILCPRVCSTGIYIDPTRLLTLLRLKYPYLGEEIHLRITGDGREYGGRHSTFISMNIVNNELILHDVSCQSPKETFPIVLFYESDSRDNLEQNLTKPNFLNTFFEKLSLSASPKYYVYLSADEMFIDHILDGSDLICPLSPDHWNIYANTGIVQKDEVAPSGLRTDLTPGFDRQHPENIFAAIMLQCIIFCVLHGLARSVEKLLNLEIQNILSESNKLAQSSSQMTGDDLISNLEANINLRGIKQGNFRVHFDKSGKAESVSLNKDSAFAIVSKPPTGYEDKFPHVLHNVVPRRSVRCSLPDQVKKYLQLPDHLTEFELVDLIWQSICEMFQILKSEPTADYSTRRKADAPKGSLHPGDYTWGYTDQQIETYKFYAERFYQLYKMRYGYKNITPYMIKFIDYGPHFMKTLEIPMCRFQAEGSEHLNYLHNCFYYSHTTRHGGKNTVEPLKALFYSMWRNLCYSIKESGDEHAMEALNTMIREHTSATIIQAHFRGFLLRKTLKLKHIVKSGEANVEEITTYNRLEALLGSIIPSAKGDKLFSGINFVLAGCIPKYNDAKYTQQQMEEIIKEHGGKVKNNIPGKLKGRSTKRYIILFSNTNVRSKVPKVIKEGISRGYDIVKYVFVFDSVQEKKTLPMKEYKTELPNLNRHITKQPSLYRKHFHKGCNMISIMKKNNRKKTKMLNIEKNPKCARNVAVFYALDKRKQMRNETASFHDQSLSFGNLMRQWKALPLDNPEKQQYLQRYKLFRQMIQERRNHLKWIKSYNAVPKYKYQQIITGASC